MRVLYVLHICAVQCHQCDGMWRIRTWFQGLVQGKFHYTRVPDHVHIQYIVYGYISQVWF